MFPGSPPSRCGCQVILSVRTAVKQATDVCLPELPCYLSSADQSIEFCRDGSAQGIVAGRQAAVRVSPAVSRVEPDRHADEFTWLPFVARPDVAVQVWVGVSEDLEVDPPKCRVERPTRHLDGLAESIHVIKERAPSHGRQVREPLDSRVVDEEERVAGKELDVPDDGEAGAQSTQDGGILAEQRAADAVLSPVDVHGGREDIR